MTWACWDGVERVYLTDSDQSDPAHGVRCVRLHDVVDVAKIIYYGGRVIQILKSLPPPP